MAGFPGKVNQRAESSGISSEDIIVITTASSATLGLGVLLACKIWSAVSSNLSRKKNVVRITMGKRRVVDRSSFSTSKSSTKLLGKVLAWLFLCGKFVSLTLSLLSSLVASFSIDLWEFHTWHLNTGMGKTCWQAPSELHDWKCW